jgi:adenine-specific DNA-methyltransferase
VKKSTSNTPPDPSSRNLPFRFDFPGAKRRVSILNEKPAQTIRPGKQEHAGKHNAFYAGDNLPLLQLLRDDLSGKVDLVYIDPPFGTGQSFNDRKDRAAYSDLLIDGAFLEFLRRRLFLLHDCLSDQGSLYLHIDKKTGHYVKLILDEVFGPENFINDISRIKCNPKNFDRNAYGNSTDMILYYAKERDRQIWNDLREPLTEKQIHALFPLNDPLKGPYTTHPLHAPGETQKGDTGKRWKGLLPPKGRHWRYNRAELDRLDLEGLIEWSSKGNPRKKMFAKDHPGAKLQDFWEFKDKGYSYVPYPTQKNEALLRRIILNSSNEDSLVLDCFAGSGTTLEAASGLGRWFIGMDNSPQALEVIRKGLREKDIPCNYFFLREEGLT